MLRERRVQLLVLLLLISVLAIWRPWLGLEPEARGLKFGIDIVGGSRIMLGLDATQVTIGDVDRASVDDIVDLLDEGLKTPVKAIDYDETTRRLKVEIGRSVTEGLVSSIIGDRWEVIEVKSEVSDSTRDDVIRTLEARVDPYGTRGSLFKPVGANFVLFEITGLSPEQARLLLGKQGVLEAFIGGDVVFRGGGIERVDTPGPHPEERNTYIIPLRVSQAAAERFAKLSEGKAGYPLVIYLDRPADAIILFDEALLGELPPEVSYDEEARTFSFREIGSLPATFAKIDKGSIPQQTLRLLEEQREAKARILLLGSLEDLQEGVIRKLAELYPALEAIPRLEGEGPSAWIRRASGFVSAPIIQEGIAGKAEREPVISITRGTLEEAADEARSLYVILSQRLPVRIAFESELGVEPRLGAEFRDEILRVGVVALAAVAGIVFLRYRRPTISAAIVGTAIAELIITLGAASVFGLAIGLPELGGLIIILGTGVDHQLIITDEVLRGGLPGAKRVGLDWRFRRAFSVVFAAAATTIAAMVMLALLGFGAMRGFALITIVGLLASVLVTRPAFARILNSIVGRG